MRTTVLLALLCALVVVANAPAQMLGPSTTRPAVTTNATAASTFGEPSAMERRTIGSSNPGGAAGVTAAGDVPAPQPQHSIGFDLGRMAIALAIVLGLIFGARWLVIHFFAGGRAPATSKAVKVLGRTSLAPRQQVLLLQVGRRVVVVGESNSQLTTLAQLDDPDEVASLLGQLQEEQIQRGAAFGGIFGRVQRRFSGETEEDEHTASSLSDLEGQPAEPSLEPANDAQAKSELAGLVDKVRSIREQLGR